MKEIKGYVLKTHHYCPTNGSSRSRIQWLTAATTVITFELNNFFLQFFILLVLINKRDKAVIRKELMLLDCLRWLKL